MEKSIQQKYDEVMELFSTVRPSHLEPRTFERLDALYQAWNEERLAWLHDRHHVRGQILDELRRLGMEVNNRPGNPTVKTEVLRFINGAIETVAGWHDERSR